MAETKLSRKPGAEEGNEVMSTVKLLRGGQVTLPVEIRRALGLGEGDVLEAKILAGAVVLEPKALVDREQAWERLMRVVERPKWQGPGPEPDEGRVDRGRGRVHPRHVPRA